MKTAVPSRKDTQLAEPAHLGGFVRAEIIENHDLSVTEVARALGITRAELSAFINEHSGLSSGRSLRIEKALVMFIETCACRTATISCRPQARENEIRVEPFKGQSLTS